MFYVGLHNYCAYITIVIDVENKAKRHSKLSKSTIAQIFKQVSFNGLNIGIEELIPPKNTIDKLLTAYYHNDHNKLNKLANVVYYQTMPCSGPRASIDIRTSTLIIEPNTGIDTQDIPITNTQCAQNEAESRVYTDELVNNVTRGVGGENE